MSAARIVAGAVAAALPEDYCPVIGQFVNDNAKDGRAVSVIPLGGAREVWGIGGDVPQLIRDRVRVRLRALADDNDWLNEMSDRVRYAVLALGSEPTTRGRVYFSPDTWFPYRPGGAEDEVAQTWLVVRVQTDTPPSHVDGRRYSRIDIGFLVIMRPLASRPLRVPLAWRGSPFLVREASSTAPAVEVQRTAVADGRVIVGGQFRFGAPRPATNPPDEPFPDGGVQGSFPGAAAGEVLWRDTSVATRTTGSGGSREVNLFTGSLNDVPHQTGGAPVRLLKVVLNANDTVSIVTRDRFDPGLEANGLFFWRIAGMDAAWTFPLAGSPVTRVGDFHYDVAPPPAAGFRTALAEMANLGDWAFADGRTWRTEPWQSEPPTRARWQATWVLTDGVGNQLASRSLLGRDDTPLGDGAGRTLLAIAQPAEVMDHGGELVQTVTLRDESDPPVTARGRYTVPVTVDGLILHGEDVAAPAPEAAGQEGFNIGYVDEGYGA